MKYERHCWIPEDVELCAEIWKNTQQWWNRMRCSGAMFHSAWKSVADFYLNQFVCLLVGFIEYMTRIHSREKCASPKRRILDLIAADFEHYCNESHTFCSLQNNDLRKRANTHNYVARQTSSFLVSGFVDLIH